MHPSSCCVGQMWHTYDHVVMCQTQTLHILSVYKMYTSYTTIKTLDVLNRIKYPIFVFFSKTLLENPPPLKKFKASDTRK